MQEKFGYVKIDGAGATSLSLYGKLKLHGTKIIEGDGISADNCLFIPSFCLMVVISISVEPEAMFNGSHISSTSNSINQFTNVIPTHGNASYIYRGLYITPVMKTY